MVDDLLDQVHLLTCCSWVKWTLVQILSSASQARMSGGKYLVLCMKWAFSIPGKLTWKRHLTLLSRREQVTNNFFCVSLSRNYSVSGAVLRTAGIDNHSGSMVAPVQA